MAPQAVFDELIWHLRGRSFCVLTGAGVSTDSGIPDYRGPEGSLKTRTPVRYHEFIRSAEDRQRYWARSCVGWPVMRARRPNTAHTAIAELQHRGKAAALITQNVDGLHQAAGSHKLIELHGGLARVLCLECAAISDRNELQDRMLELNPGWLQQTAEAAPDGDAELPREVTRRFHVPACRSCGGVLKPDVVFFGENVPRNRVAAAFDSVNATDALLVIGSSLTVYSGFRFADHAVKSRKTLAIINHGPTRADAIASVKLDAVTGNAVPRLAAAL